MENRYELNKNLAQMLKGGVIMDVTTPEQARIAQEAGACAVMALERIPADIRAAGGVSRMSDPAMIKGIQEAVSIPVMAKCRIGHFVEAQLLEAIDTNILRIYHKKQWGYNLQFYLAASNDCHPNYIGYLLSKKTLSVRAINEIVKGIPPEKKLDYDKAVIEELYINYQKKTVWDTGSMGRLQAELGKKNLLLLGPGKTLISHQSVIDKYIQRERPVILSVNFLPDHVMPDFVFISNAKRYSMLVSGLDACGSEIKVIATSNITAISKQFDYVMDYAGLLDGSGVIMDNGLIMLLNALCACGPEKVVLAGFDGFGQHMDESYFDDQMEMSVDYDRLAEINAAIKERLPAFKAQLPVSFLTPSLYEGET